MLTAKNIMIEIMMGIMIKIIINITIKIGITIEIGMMKMMMAATVEHLVPLLP